MDNKKKFFNFIKIKKLTNSKKNFFLVKIINIDDRCSASKLMNSRIMIKEKMLPKLKDNQYYWKDLINCKVFDGLGRYIGIVKYLIETGSNDVLVLKHEFSNKKKEILIPFLIGKTIKTVNILSKKIIITHNL
ncbi:hypothetical protein AOQ88_00065 [Candidatus Riesia sp. GBBU]|nr:hypothetical protein AOQ88_00065 [Candidatus Riesia sp. GBBU]